MSAGLLNSIVALITLAGLAWLLYRPKLQESRTYKATVVPSRRQVAAGAEDQDCLLALGCRHVPLGGSLREGEPA